MSGSEAGSGERVAVLDGVVEAASDGFVVGAVGGGHEAAIVAGGEGGQLAR